MSQPVDASRCARCGTSIDATDSVQLTDGVACLDCIDAAAKEGALRLVAQQRIRHTVAWAGLSVALLAAARFVEPGTAPRVLEVLGAVAFVAAGLSLWRASRARRAAL